MSRFYASITSERKPKTLQGLNRITAHVRTWDHGIRVEYKPSEKIEGKWDCHIYVTGGSNDSENRRCVKVIRGIEAPNRRPGSAYYGHVFGGVK